jgi:hypothetical protein
LLIDPSVQVHKPLEKPEATQTVHVESELQHTGDFFCTDTQYEVYEILEVLFLPHHLTIFCPTNFQQS